MTSTVAVLRNDISSGNLAHILNLHYFHTLKIFFLSEKKHELHGAKYKCLTNMALLDVQTGDRY